MYTYALGPKGTNGHETADRYVRAHGRSVESIVLCPTHTVVLKYVAEGHGQGVVAVENSRGGLVDEVVQFRLTDEAAHGHLCVQAEIWHPVYHQLLVHPDVTGPEEIRRVISHPQALAQCRRHLDGMGIQERFPVASTAEAARRIAEEDLSVAAIGSVFAGGLYGLKALNTEVQDDLNNNTRFHVVGQTPVEPTGTDRTAIIFEMEDRPWALRDVLDIIGLGRTNLSSLHSIPLGPGQYAFYCEFDLHIQTETGARIRSELEFVVSRLIVLGSYPRDPNAGR